MRVCSGSRGKHFACHDLPRGDSRPARGEMSRGKKKAPARKLPGLVLLAEHRVLKLCERFATSAEASEDANTVARGVESSQSALQVGEAAALHAHVPPQDRPRLGARTLERHRQEGVGIQAGQKEAQVSDEDDIIGGGSYIIHAGTAQIDLSPPSWRWWLRPRYAFWRLVYAWKLWKIRHRW
jgi:hypothetical protein